MTGRIFLFCAACFLTVFVASALAGEACVVPPLEVDDSGQGRGDHGCAAVVRALATVRFAQTSEEQRSPITPPAASEVSRCAQLLRGAGRFFLEPDVDTLRSGGGLLLPGAQAMRHAAARGRTTAAPSTASYDAVTFAGCGVHFPVFMDLDGSVAGFMRSKDGRYLVAVHVGERRYSGAAVPYYLERTRVSVLDLETLEVVRVPLEQFEFSIQSVAVAVDGARLLVRLKDVWNTGGDKRLYLQCQLDGEKCGLEPTLSPAGFPKDKVLEITASGAYLLEEVPVSAKLPSNALRRTVRVSPDRKQLAYVVEQARREKVERTLYVADSSGKRVRRVASGMGLFHVEWLAADRFVFEDDPKPSSTFAALRKKVLAKAEVKEFVAAAKHQGELEQLEQMLDILVLKHVSEEVGAGRMKPLSPEDAQEERLMEYRTTTGKVAPFNELRHVRLLGEFQYPNLRSDDVVEVAPD